MDEHELPTLYGGLCKCKATCVYSEKGPWSEVENRVNYQKPDENSDDSGEELKQHEVDEKLPLDRMLRDVSIPLLI